MVTARLAKRWQVVWGTLGEEAAPFAPGALGAFRARLLPHALERTLVARPVALAKASGKLGWQPLHAAWDSAPLLGAGRVEDPWNLLGRAMPQLVVLARQGTGLAQDGIRHQAGGRSWATPACKRPSPVPGLPHRHAKRACRGWERRPKRWCGGAPPQRGGAPGAAPA